MKLNIVCATWIRDEDEIVLSVLEAADRWLSAEELAVITGLPLRRINHTLRLLKQQQAFYKGRKRIRND